jgi:DNA-binding MarR family transcriptional regulator
MPRLVRITIALDEESANILEKLAKKMGVSYSTLIRLALKFFPQHGGSVEDLENIKLWSSLLSKGEHIILDIDHWLLFLKYIESSEKRESFYNEGKKIAKSHAEQLSKITPTAEGYLKRLEACNFYRLSKDSEDEYTLILNSDLAKRFIKELISETLTQMGFNLDIKENLMKLRVKIIGRKTK